MEAQKKLEMLNEGQKSTFELIKEGNNVYIGGPGGVGKSFLIDVLREYFGNSAVFLAPTGIAALNIKGATLHSTFGLPMGVCSKSNWDRVPDRVFDLFSDDLIKTIVIDEISMVRSDVFETVDHYIRRAKRKNIPFGGIQVITVGDFFQLPPVIKHGSAEAKHFFEEYDSEFCFTTDSWKSARFINSELTDVVRQDDEVMIRHLQNIRMKTGEYVDSVDFFNHHCEDNPNSDDDDTVLCTTNKNANMVNESNYEQIEGPEKVYRGVSWGNFKERPAPEYLKLKVGCKVLIVANTDTHTNGEVGYVSEINQDSVNVMRGPDDTVLVEKFRWNEYRYVRTPDGGLSMEIASSYSQLPLKHGYGITIHKSQGMTLETATIYMGRGAFAHGQTYVALSRVKSMEGLNLMSPIRAKDIIVHSDVIDFYNGKYNNLLS